MTKVNLSDNEFHNLVHTEVGRLLFDYTTHDTWIVVHPEDDMKAMRFLESTVSDEVIYEWVDVNNWKSKESSPSCLNLPLAKWAIQKFETGVPLKVELTVQPIALRPATYQTHPTLNGLMRQQVALKSDPTQTPIAEAWFIGNEIVADLVRLQREANVFHYGMRLDPNEHILLKVPQKCAKFKLYPDLPSLPDELRFKGYQGYTSSTPQRTRRFFFEKEVLKQILQDVRWALPNNEWKETSEGCFCRDGECLTPEFIYNSEEIIKVYSFSNEDMWCYPCVPFTSYKLDEDEYQEYFIPLKLVHKNWTRTTCPVDCFGDAFEEFTGRDRSEIYAVDYDGSSARYTTPWGSPWE